MAAGSLFEQDVRATLESRARLDRNPNLLYWYDRLYRRIFAGRADLQEKVILEVGSGASPLKRTVPSAITSDIMPLDHVDHVFDCHEIDRYPGIADRSVDILTLTNVLHHLAEPLRFLKNAQRKLRRGGEVIITEPYFSVLSYPVYKLLHHEPAHFDVREPLLTHVEGPLSSSNQAIPYMIFFSKPEWLGELRQSYDLAATRLEFFTSLSYMMTGGISRTLPVPHGLYRMAYGIDEWLADKAPRLFASFFIARLVAF